MGKAEAEILKKGESMSEITIRLPEAMKEYVDSQLASGEYASAAEFINALLREDQKRRATEELKAKIREADAGGLEEITQAYWEDVDKTFNEKFRQGQAQ